MVRIKLNSFFILFLLASLYSGYINQSIIIFISVLLHEIGHAMAASYLGIRVEEIELFPFGGVAKMEDMTKYGGYIETYIAIAGPLVSGIIAAIGAALNRNMESYRTIAQYNLILLIFNLLPALPMDGGRILRNILIHYLSYKQATKAMAVLGRLIAIALVLYNINILYRGSISIAFIITAVFIYLGCQKEMNYCSYYYLLHKNNHKKNHMKRRRLRTRIIDVHEDTLVRLAANQFSPGTVCIIHVLDSSDNVVRILSEVDIMNAFLKYGYDCKIGEIKN